MISELWIEEEAVDHLEHGAAHLDHEHGPDKIHESVEWAMFEPLGEHVHAQRKESKDDQREEQVEGKGSGTESQRLAQIPLRDVPAGHGRVEMSP